MDQLDWLFDQPPFVDLDQAGRTQVGSDVQITYLPAGTHVGREGDRLDAVWVVRRGAVRRHQPGPDIVVEEGELIGAREALEDRTLVNDHEVIEDLLAYLIPTSTFRELAGQDAVRQTLSHRDGTDTSGLTVTARTVAGPSHRIDGSATVAEAAQVMEAAGVDALLVGGQDATPGILTARDLRSRVLARGLGPDTTVAEVATGRASLLDPDTPLSEALLFLLEHDIHHAPLADGGGCRLMLTDDDILAHYGSDSFSLLRRLATDAGEDGRFADRVTRAVQGMVRADIGPATIGRAVTSLIDGLMRSLCRSAEQELGPAPAPFALCACGSQGRREQTLLTDQDNLLVHLGTPDDEAWFAQLAERVVSGMVAAGIPACSGGYMATRWRGSRSWWEETVAGWVADPGPEALLDLNIVADLRVIVGDLPAEDLRRPLHEAMTHPLLVRRLAAEVIRFRPPGRFSRLFGRGEDFDVKKHGLIPIVGLGRLFGLQLGVSSPSTVRRLEAAEAAGLISGDAKAWLVDGLDFLTGLRLDGQLRSLEATGDAATEPIRRDDLDPVQRATLREVLRVIADVQHTTSDRLGLDAIG